MPVIEMCLRDEKADPVQGDPLCRQDGLREPIQPWCDIQRLLVPLKLIVLSLPLPLDRVGQRDQARLARVLRQ